MTGVVVGCPAAADQSVKVVAPNSLFLRDCYPLSTITPPCGQTSSSSHCYHHHLTFCSRLRTSAFCLLLFFTITLIVFQMLLNRSYGSSSSNPALHELGKNYNNVVLGRDLLSSQPLQKPSLLPNSSRVRFPRTKRRLPQCIIIGVRKCGTRALLEFLNLHPMVQMASEEVHFFDDDSNYAMGLEWYRRRMPYSFPGQITVEKSPAYFITSSAPIRIRSMDPHARLLLIVRDPVTRLISDYAQLASNKARKDRRLASFEDLAIRPDGSINTSYKAVRIGMYALFFRRWLDSFPRHQIHIVDGDALVLDPYLQVRKIETFLGLDHRISRDNFYYNRTKGFFCVRNTTSEKCLNESKGRKHPQVSRDALRKLGKFYKPYNRHFYRQTGIKFHWMET